MSKKTIAIIIPAHNEEGSISQCLESIARQTIKPDEVIVVDNNCTDRTVEQAKKFSFVKIINEKKQGIANAHHAGCKVAASELLGRIDADTSLPENWVESVLSYYSVDKNNNKAIFGTGYGRNLRFYHAHTFGMDIAHYIAKILAGHFLLWGSNMVIPKSQWDSVAPITCKERHNTFDDFDLALHLHENGTKIELQRHLRVGVTIRSIYSFRSYFRYCMRIPGTFKNHGSWRWPLAYLFMVPYSITYYPFFYLVRKQM